MSSKNGTKPAAAGADSIAARLTFWYALLSVVLIASAGSMLYWVLTDRLQQEDDRLLAGKIAEARAVLLLHPSDYAALREEVQHEAETLPGIYIRVLNGQGNIVADSPDFGAIFGDHGSFATSPLSPDEHGQDWTSSDGKKYRILSGKFDAGSQFIVHAAMSLSKEEQFLAGYRKTLLLAVAIALVIAVVVGYLIARRGLTPVSRLASIVSELSAAHLHLRIGNDAWPRELKPLAANFDQLLSRLEESFARIARFSADIAHELRTPLHILRGEAEMALTKARSSEEYRACVESAAEEYERLTRMVDALLFLARTEHRDAQLDKKPLAFDQEIAAVCAFHQAMADEHEIKLITGGVGVVLADSGLLRRALSNLIVNALRHTPSGGRIIIEAKETPDRETEIVVRDTGEGIATEDLPHLFDRFYRADSARLRQGTGTGLGLAIVQSIMQLHGGTVSLDSELGRGTAVMLKFPH
ncbi:MAG: heavy metal sensor histidine kinase [Pseudomonadota bacterium]